MGLMQLKTTPGCLSTILYIFMSLLYLFFNKPEKAYIDSIVYKTKYTYLNLIFISFDCHKLFSNRTLVTW